MTKQLSDRDLDTLGDLLNWRNTDGQDKGARPLDIGASNGSHHSATLRKLAGKGLVEKVTRSSFGSRGSYRYRITEAGAKAYSEAMAARAKS